MKNILLLRMLFFLSLLFTTLFIPLKDSSAQTKSKLLVTIPTEIEPIEAPFPMPQLKRPQFPDRTFNIIDFGAKGDGVTKNTEAFRKAIDACSAAGGGTVLVPAGKWLTGAIHLKSNVNLHFEMGAELHFSDNPDDYLPAVFTRWAGTEVYNYSPLIYANNCENIAVTGPGKLFGHGDNWWDWFSNGEKTIKSIYKNQVLKNILPNKRIAGTPEAGLRPQFISPVNCKNVLFEGFSISSPGPFWTFDIIYCENVIVRGLTVETRGGPNTDGINFNSCKNALIEYCSLNTGDDAVGLKSGINEDGWRVGRPTENVVIRNVEVFYSLGAIIIGSDMSGGIRNIYAHDCNFDGSDIGIRIKSNASRGGIVENIYFDNIRMDNIMHEAIRVETNYGAFMASENGDAFPTFRNFNFSNITCEYADQAITMQGTMQKPVENVVIKNSNFQSRQPMKIQWVNGLSMDNVIYNYKDNPFMLDDVLFTQSHKQGLEAEYFDNKDLKGKAVVTRVDKNLNFYWWASIPPVSGVSKDDFSVRWKGFLKVPESGAYEIGLQADDGFRLFLDNKLLVDAWNENNICEYKGTVIQLEKDKFYDLKIEYYEHLGFGCTFFRLKRANTNLDCFDIYKKTNVDSLITIHSEKDALKVRNNLINYVFGKEGIPYNKMPNKIVKNFSDKKYDDIESLQSITELVVNMDFGLDSKIYHFISKKPNNKLAIYHQGHRGDFIYGKATIKELLDNGYSVLAFAMPLKGMNSKPIIDLPKIGYLHLTDHNQIKFLTPNSGHPVKYFIEPVIVAINYILKNFNYKNISMIGISGGGWTTTLVAALDSRIKNSFPVAGSYPVYLRSDSVARDWGDWEQTIPELLQNANYLEMYILGAYGKGRKQLQILNRYDKCCFAGFKWKTYKDKVVSKVEKLGKGSWNLLLDDTHHEHKISKYAMKNILNEMEK